MNDWLHAPEPALRPGPLGWLRAGVKGLALGTLTFGGLAVLLALRLVERPLFGRARPWTPHITQTVCRAAFVILGLRRVVHGQPMHNPGAVVANHASWLDIFTLNASQRIYFVAKSEVQAWPGIGWLARGTGTLFIARKGTEALAQTRVFTDRLGAGHPLLFFPEGTSTDSRRILPFKSSLFQAFLAPGLVDTIQIQPVTVAYHAPAGADPRLYGWWGTMDFASHLVATLAAARHGRVEVTYHPPLCARDYRDRKALAAACEAAVRSAWPFGQT